MRYRRLRIAVAGLVLSLCAGAGAEQLACEITIQPGESIQAGIDAAPEGAVICLSEGVWKENLTISKSLTLRGVSAEATSIHAGSPEKEAITIIVPEGEETVDVSIDSVTVAQASGYFVAGIEIRGPAHLAITDSVIVENAYGIRMWDSSEVTIADSAITANYRGISVGDSAEANITDCNVTGNFHGIESWSSELLAIRNCTISGNAADGIHHPRHVAVTDCTISENGRTGIFMELSDQAVITNCTVSANGSAGSQLFDSAQASIVDCTIAGNHHGLELRDSVNVTIIGNEVFGNTGFGLLLFEQPCYDVSTSFSGCVTGSGNVIPGLGEPSENGGGAVCPGELGFLMTEEGGKLDGQD